MKKNIELMAPVGSIESLYAAIENGANAIYLGGKLFNARHYASNFDFEELKAAVEYAHLREVKIYVTLNILLDESELEQVIDYLIFLYNIDVDALIVQDLGLIKIIKELFPDFELSGSTQMTVNNYMGAKFLEEQGFKKVVLARELSIKEIKYISENTNIELEAFIHGALCVCYSGQCLMSSMFGGRSGNRGTCAQPCRMPYSIVNIKNGQIISDRFNEKYILSPKDLNTIEYIQDIVNAGVTSLKIEGRMKKPEYVAVIVDKYRRALDSLDSDKNIEIKKRDIKEMAQMFNRGFTKGYIMNDFGKDLISFDKPNNRGVEIGKVVRKDNSYIYIQLEDSLNKGDGIELVNLNGDSFGTIVSSMHIDKKETDRGSFGDIVRIKNVNGVSKGATVNKTFDIELNKIAKETYINRKNKIGIEMSILIALDKPLKLTITDFSNSVTVFSKEKAEKGIKVSLNKERVITQLGKLGDTPYELLNIDVCIDENVMVPMSVLNKLRRDGIEELNKKRGNINNRVEIKKNDLVPKIKELFDFPGNQGKSSNKISVKVSNFGQFNQLDLDKLDRVYLDFSDDIEECIKEVKHYEKEAYIYTDKIINNAEFKSLEKLLDKNISDLNGVSVSNIGTLKFIKDKYNTNIHCDIGLNTFNSMSAKMLFEYGAGSITLSPELTLNQIGNICNKNNVIYETIGYGYLPLMVTKHCPFALVKGCKDSKECERCKYNSGFGLKDRKKLTFELLRKGEYTTIYNSQALMALDFMDKIYTNGVNMVRLDFTIESEIKDIQSVYYEYANKNIGKDDVLDFINNYKRKYGITKGHYFRGVLINS